MPITTTIRPWHRPSSTAAEQVLVPKTEFADRHDAEVGAEMERQYFTPLGGESAPIALSVNNVSVGNVLGVEPRVGERGDALLGKVIENIRAAFVGAGVPPAIAYFQAHDIARYLGSSTFLEADQVLVENDPTQQSSQQAIDVHIDGNTVCIHKTTTYTDVADGQAQEPPKLTRVVDLAVKFTSTRRCLSSTRELEAEVIKATVQLGPSPQREKRFTATQDLLGVPDVPVARSRCWERLKQMLSRLFSARGIKFVVGAVNDLTRPEDLARPAGIVRNLPGVEDASAWFVRAAQAYGPRRYDVASYRDANGFVIRNGTAGQTETHWKSVDARARTIASERAGVLREGHPLNVGNVMVAVDLLVDPDPHDPRHVVPLPQHTYGRGTACVSALAQDDARLREEQHATLNDALFPAPGTPRLLIAVDDQDMVGEHLLVACRQLRALEQRAPLTAADLQAGLQALVTAFDLPHNPPVEQIATVKAALCDKVIARIRAALPNDLALQWRVLATLPHVQPATHLVMQSNGVPMFENNLAEQRQITISTRRTRPHVRAGTVRIAFRSDHRGLSAGGEVHLGPEIFRAGSLQSARMSTVALYDVSNETTQLKFVQCRGHLEPVPLA
ncbi:hypothetical protein [Pandoraea sputorum]|uniref:Uncharacterized protein n=1 Tax=Pandoraea sputorum TaxID=93222 RepID=A0A5E5BIE7_9BURK|nr:hypothetical protein [Pandoraea sputorum]VVE86001.1 hypothetical protein PSP31121_05640 [Pandoraea sputorum]